MCLYWYRHISSSREERFNADVTDIRKDYVWNTIGTSAVAFISLLLLIAVTRINGLDAAGVFSFCFSFAILFFMIGLFGGRIYQVSDVRGEFESRSYILLKFITSAAMLLTTVIFILANGYDRERVLLLLSLVVYKILDAIADPLYGVMQRQGRLYYAGISMTLKAVIGFVAFVLVNLITYDLLLSSLCLLAANAIFIVVYDIPHVRKLEKIGRMSRDSLKPTFTLLKASVYIFAFALFANLLVNIPRYFVDLHFPYYIVGLFGIIIMLATMLNLFVTFVIQPKLVSLSDRFAAAEYASFNRTVTKLILISLVFGVIAIVVTWLIGAPVLSFIYTEDLMPYRLSLTLVVVAGTINTITMIYSNMLSIMRRFKIQLVNFLIATGSIFAASAVFIASDSVDGAIMAFLIANAVQAVLFFISYQVIFRKVLK